MRKDSLKKHKSKNFLSNNNESSCVLSPASILSVRPDANEFDGSCVQECQKDTKTHPSVDTKISTCVPVKLQRTSFSLNNNDGTLLNKWMVSNSMDEQLPKFNQLSNSHSLVELKITTDKARLGQTHQVCKIPGDLQKIFGGDLKLPVSSTDNLVYIVTSPLTPGTTPRARKYKTKDEHVPCNVTRIEINSSSSTTDKNGSSHSNKINKKFISSVFQPKDRSELMTTDGQDCTSMYSKSKSNIESQPENKHVIPCPEKKVDFENQTTKENEELKNCTDTNKSSLIKNSLLGFCNLMQTFGTSDCTNNCNSTKEDVTMKTTPSQLSSDPSPDLFSQDLTDTTTEFPKVNKVAPSLCAKKPLFKRKKPKIPVEYLDSDENDCDDNTFGIKENDEESCEPKQCEVKAPNIRFSSNALKNEDFEQNENNSDEQVDEERLVLKRKNCRRSLSLKSTSAKKIKQENCCTENKTMVSKCLITLTIFMKAYLFLVTFIRSNTSFLFLTS